MLINIYKLVVSHAKDKFNLFIETSLAEEIHFFLSHIIWIFGISHLIEFYICFQS